MTKKIKYPCECLDLNDMTCWLNTSGRAIYDSKSFHKWALEYYGSEASLDFGAGFECAECGEQWEKEQVESYANNKK